jgi:hypothetical protein
VKRTPCVVASINDFFVDILAVSRCALVNAMVALSYSKEGSLHAEDAVLAPTLVLARVVRPPPAVNVLISRKLRWITHI